MRPAMDPARPGTAPFPWRTVTAVAAGGILGAVGRYALASAMQSRSGQFPWTTFLVNITGAALLGLLLIAITESLPDDHVARPFACTGIIGAYTTFSGYMIDADLLVRGHHYATAATYLASSLGAGMAAVWAGVTAARAVLRTSTIRSPAIRGWAGESRRPGPQMTGRQMTGRQIPGPQVPIAQELDSLSRDPEVR